jgi:anthranilate synthase component 1
MHPASPAQALALQRRLPSAPDPLALFAALTDQGRRRDTILLERNVGPSLLMDKAALRIETRGQDVTLEALSAGGRQVLGQLRRHFRDHILSDEAGTLHLVFPRMSGDDSEARLLAPSPLDVLRCLTGLGSASHEEPFTIALLGVSAFDQVDLFESLPANQDDPLGFPDSVYWLAESQIVFEPGAVPRLVCTAFGGGPEAYHDSASRLADLYQRCAAPPPLPPAPAPAAVEGVEVDLDDKAYGAVVAALKEHIAAGDIYQVVPSRTFRAPCADPLLAFHALRKLDPSPYRFFLSAPGYQLFGASPETSVRVFLHEGWKTLEVKPIAGTRPRGATADEDDRFEAELRLDGKELAEHMMLVDLARNDVARISVPGTRRVARLMTVERYARVMHLVSSVTGTMRIGYDALHALQACLNVGTLAGAPKIRATELLRRFEKTKRGPYGGAIGWLSGDGLMDTGVIIRSAVVKDGTAYVRAGAGVVYDSDPQREADETLRKASALLSILAAAGACR